MQSPALNKIEKNWFYLESADSIYKGYLYTETNRARNERKYWFFFHFPAATLYERKGKYATTGRRKKRRKRDKRQDEGYNKYFGFILFRWGQYAAQRLRGGC